MEICFKRHEDNPMDSLGIGRIQERKAQAYNELVIKAISDIDEIARDYPGVRFINQEPIYCTDKIYSSDPFYGFKIQLNICTFEYYTEPRFARLRWYSQVGQKEMNKFGEYEEIKLAFKYWLKQYCYHKDGMQ